MLNEGTMLSIWTVGPAGIARKCPWPAGSGPCCGENLTILTPDGFNLRQALKPRCLLSCVLSVWLCYELVRGLQDPVDLRGCLTVVVVLKADLFRYLVLLGG